MARTFNPQDSISDDPFEVLPVGKYVVRVKALEKRKGRSDDYLNLTLTICAGPLEKNPIDKKQKFSGRLVWDILSYSPKAMSKLGQAFIAVGHPQPPKNLDDMTEMRNEVFQGRVAVVAVRHEEYQGQRKAKVARWQIASDQILDKWPHQPPGKSGGGFDPIAAHQNVESDDDYDAEDSIPF